VVGAGGRGDTVARKRQRPTLAIRLLPAGRQLFVTTALVLLHPGKSARAADADGGEPLAATRDSDRVEVAPSPATTAAAFGAVQLNAQQEDDAPGPEHGATVAVPSKRPARATVASASSTDWQAPDEPANRDCSLHGKLQLDVSRCNTPRDGTLSGLYLAFDLGAVSPKGAAAGRVGIGTGPAAQFRFGMEFWDQLIVGIGGAFLDFSDQRPTTESVVVCTTFDGVETGCDQEPTLAKSDVRAGAGSLEVGYQKRFRPSRTKSVSIGLIGGFLETFGHLKSLTGDLLQFTTLGIKAGRLSARRRRRQRGEEDRGSRPRGSSPSAGATADRRRARALPRR